ncbi:MAG: SprT-like domain-containing protein [Planctomycetes bacterium]|nr:SprT-like domain-containing protein [Planctomycetota bacterium]
MSLPTVAELTERCAALFAQWRVLDTRIEVAWNDRLTTTAGRAFQKRGRIELNPKVLARAPDQVSMVLAHEAAHIAAFRLFGANIPAHGRHWRSLMRLAGHEPAVTHDIPVDDLRAAARARPRRATFVYLRVCDACGDRQLMAALRYGRCGGCDARDSFLVMKARAGAAGRAALERLTLAQVRAAFG